jgi:DNA gyrase inhibitor GyrI
MSRPPTSCATTPASPPTGRWRPKERSARKRSPGDYAVTTHRGPYEKLPETYSRLYGDWLPASGREPAEAPGFQLHRTIGQDAPAEDLLTDIYVPLRPR